MMSADEAKRTSILDRFRPVAGKAERPAPEEADELGNRKPKSTSDLKALTVWLDPVAIKQFKLLAREEDKQIQELMAEAMNLVFEKYHKGQIA